MIKSSVCLIDKLLIPLHACPLQTFVKNHHKVGVIRVREGQRTEEEIFSNIHEPGPYDAFLNLLGESMHG